MDNRSEMHIKHQLSQLLPSETLILITQDFDVRWWSSDCDGEGNIIADGPKAQVLSDLSKVR